MRLELQLLDSTPERRWYSRLTLYVCVRKRLLVSASFPVQVLLAAARSPSHVMLGRHSSDMTNQSRLLTMIASFQTQSAIPTISCLTSRRSYRDSSSYQIATSIHDASPAARHSSGASKERTAGLQVASMGEVCCLAMLAEGFSKDLCAPQETLWQVTSIGC